jgi:hypothetical protein
MMDNNDKPQGQLRFKMQHCLPVLAGCMIRAMVAEGTVVP